MANYPAAVANNYCVYSVYAVKRRNYHRLGFRYFTAVLAIIVPQIVRTILKALARQLLQEHTAGRRARRGPLFAWINGDFTSGILGKGIVAAM